MNFLEFIYHFTGILTAKHGVYSQTISYFVILLSLVSLYFCWRPNAYADRILLWVFGAALILFTALRPFGLNNDDVVYESIVSNICPLFKCNHFVGEGRDIIWFAAISFLKIFTGGVRAYIILSSIGVCIKIFVIDRLCKHKTLTLLLYVSLVYIQYDFTMIRAGLASTWFFVGIFCLERGYVTFGIGAMLTNGFVHAQAFVSPFVLMYRAFIKQWMLPCFVVLIFILIYIGFTPRLQDLQFLNQYSSTSGYYASRLNGVLSIQRPLAIAYIAVILYAVWLCWSLFSNKLTQIVSASIFLALLLCWFLVEVPAIQHRLIEFYLAPVIFLAGNIRSNRWQVLSTIILSVALYVRLEIVHDWILG